MPVQQGPQPSILKMDSETFALVEVGDGAALGKLDPKRLR